MKIKIFFPLLLWMCIKSFNAFPQDVVRLTRSNFQFTSGYLDVYRNLILTGPYFAEIASKAIVFDDNVTYQYAGTAVEAGLAIDDAIIYIQTGINQFMEVRPTGVGGSSIFDATLTKDGRYLGFIAGDNAYVIDIQSGDGRRSQLLGPCSDMFHVDNNIVIVGDSVEIYDPSTLQPVHAYPFSLFLSTSAFGNSTSDHSIIRLVTIREGDIFNGGRTYRIIEKTTFSSDYTSIVNRDTLDGFEPSEGGSLIMAGNFRLSNGLLNPDGSDTVELITYFGNGLDTLRIVTFDKFNPNGTQPTPNPPPSAITLNNNSVDENSTVGTVIGRLTYTDDEPDLPFVLSGADVDAFNVTANGDLVTVQVFNFEAQSVYNLTVTVTDSSGGSLDMGFQVFVVDVNEVSFTSLADLNSVVATQTVSYPISDYVIVSNGTPTLSFETVDVNDANRTVTDFITVSGNNITITPTVTDVGTFTVTITASQGGETQVMVYDLVVEALGLEFSIQSKPAAHEVYLLSTISFKNTSSNTVTVPSTTEVMFGNLDLGPDLHGKKIAPGDSVMISGIPLPTHLGTGTQSVSRTIMIGDDVVFSQGQEVEIEERMANAGGGTISNIEQLNNYFLTNARGGTHNLGNASESQITLEYATIDADGTELYDVLDTFNLPIFEDLNDAKSVKVVFSARGYDGISKNPANFQARAIPSNVAIIDNVITANEEVQPVKELDIILYPNPSTQFFTVEGLPFGSLCQLVTLTGQIVKTVQLKNFESSCRVDVSYLPRGSYIAVFSDLSREVFLTETVLIQ